MAHPRHLRAWSSLKTISLANRKLTGVLALVMVSVLAGPLPGMAQAITTTTTQEVVINGLTITVRTRTATQIAGFYEARGFPDSALELLARHCFMTVTIQNLSKQVVWLEPGRWRVEQGAESRVLLGAEYWRQQWRKNGLSPAKQATFRWTQLPKKRDLQPNEPVGGNITLLRMSGRKPGKSSQFSINAVFATGQDRLGGDIHARFQGLSCDDGEPAAKTTK